MGLHLARSPVRLILSIATTVFGGTDTTSCTLTYAMWELSRKPVVAAKLFEEVSTVITSRDFDALPQDEVLAELPYLVSSL